MNDELIKQVLEHYEGRVESARDDLKHAKRVIKRVQKAYDAVEEEVGEDLAMEFLEAAFRYGKLNRAVSD